MNTTTDPNANVAPAPATNTRSGFGHHHHPSTATNATAVNDGPGPHNTAATGAGVGAGTGAAVGTEKGLAGNKTGNRKDYHPILFGLLTLFSIIELGLTAYYIRRGRRQGWPNRKFRSSDIFLLFLSIWTLIFSLMYMIFILTRAAHKGASMGSSALWLLLTTILWGIATGLYSTSRPGCSGSLFRNCKESTAIEVFGWLTFATLILTLLSTIHHSGRHHGHGHAGRYGQGYV